MGFCFVFWKWIDGAFDLEDLALGGKVGLKMVDY